MSKGKIGVLIEEHFDPDEYREFNQFFPSKGYEVVYLSHLWNQPNLRFGSNAEGDEVKEHVVVTTEVNGLDPAEFKCIIAIGAYATDRLRYQEKVKPGQKNNSPAVAFVRRAMATPGLKMATICHGLWLWCADPELIRGRKVTCAHNLISDVSNAGADIQYDLEKETTADIVVDGNLITSRHPGVNKLFMETIVAEIEK